jgi:hypothetical protein
LTLGEAHRRAELARLTTLLSAGGELSALRWQLVRGLRDGSLLLDSSDLVTHLRQTVVNQIAIDQPKYSGFATATAGLS